ncbi:hypothetical protein [Sphingosinicella terrae]|uniref:hypothetical protein n=1 Tax=Sphingosinicella terrae TaxID=2172047 RepID=UPI000E0D74A2|nr:hypothetical protein [Sphingosinicella terrae]
MIVALFGLVISLFAYLIAFPTERSRRFDVYAALLALHIIAAIGYWLQSFESAMDAFTYYRDPFGFVRQDPFKEGTYFVVHFVQLIRNTLGGSFLDHFLFFQCFGMIAIALMIRSFVEIAESLEMTVPLPVYFVLFLPGLHFWTAGIGKDGPMIMAISLAAWCSLRIEKRLPWLALSLAIMVCIRPHITPFVMAGMVAALLLSKRADTKVRLMLAPIAAAGLVVFIGRAAASMNMTEVSVTSVTSFVETQQGFSEDYGSGAQLNTLPLPMKIFTLMFRPFWYDAEGLMGYAASAENTVLMAFVLYLLYNWKTVLYLFRHVFFVVYCATFSSMVIFSLALISYNVGLGQRMKMMAIPPALLLLAAVYMYKRSAAARAAAAAEAAEAQAREYAAAAAAPTHV